MVSPALMEQLQRARRDAVASGLAEDRLDLQGYRSMIGSLPMPLPDGLLVHDVVAAGVPARWLRPRDAPLGRRLLYLHGGGFVAGGLDSHAAITAWLAEAAACCVLVADYRLAPEHRFPAALEDAARVYGWMLRHAPDGAVRAADEIFVVGDSAGGGLAISLMLQLQRDGIILPAAGASICPWVDLDPASSPALARSNMLRELADAYAGDAERADWRISPVRGDIQGFPPWLVQAGTADIIHDDSLALVRRAHACGSPFSLDVWPDMPHVWHKYASAVPESLAAIRTIARFLERSRLGRGDAGSSRMRGSERD